MLKHNLRASVATLVIALDPSPIVEGVKGSPARAPALGIAVLNPVARVADHDFPAESPKVEPPPQDYLRGVQSHGDAPCGHDRMIEDLAQRLGPARELLEPGAPD